MAIQKLDNTVKRKKTSIQNLEHQHTILINNVLFLFFIHFCSAGLPIYCFKRKIRECLYRVAFMNAKIKIKKINNITNSSIKYNCLQRDLNESFRRIASNERFPRESLKPLHAPIQRNASRCSVTFHRISYTI